MTRPHKAMKFKIQKKEVIEMVKVKDIEILAYFLKGELVCRNCVKPEEVSGTTAYNTLFKADLKKSDYYFFCDRGGERLSPD